MRSIDCDPREPAPSTQAVTPETALSAGDKDLANDHCAAAVANYSRFVDAHPESVKGYWRRALAESAIALSVNDLSRFGAVVTDMDKAIAIDPNVADFYMIRGTGRSALFKNNFFAHTGFFKLPKKSPYSMNDVFNDFSKAIELAPTMGEAYVSRYTIDLVNRDSQEAAYDYRKASELDPDDLNQTVAAQNAINRRMDETYARTAAFATGLFMASMAAEGY